MSFTVVTLIALALAALPAALFLWNLPQLRAPGRKVRNTLKAALSPVSVLIPARNEAHNLRGALSAVLENRGVPFEVVVLDDHSEDNTAGIVREFAATDRRVRLESAPALPAGWCGKQHACQVLAQRARHPLLVFVDADVRLAPDALRRLAEFMADSPAALASGVPRQLTGTWLEKLLLPLIHFILLGFLPLWRMRRSRQPAYGAGCGQLLVARADAYFAAGGHAAIRDSLHDGLQLPRAFRRAGWATDLFDATAIASCRMYHNAAEVVVGLAKNAHEGLAHRALIGPWTLLLLGGQVLPWLLLTARPTGHAAWLCLAACGCTVLPRALAAWRFRQSWLGACLHPLGVALFVGVQWWAWGRSLRQRPATWKGRAYQLHPKTAAPAHSPQTATLMP